MVTLRLEVPWCFGPLVISYPQGPHTQVKAGLLLHLLRLETRLI